MATELRYRSCKVCGASVPYVTISARGLCPDHSRIRVEQNLIGMKSKRGPAWRRWREAMARSVGGALLDERRDSA